MYVYIMGIVYDNNSINILTCIFIILLMFIMTYVIYVITMRMKYMPKVTFTHDIEQWGPKLGEK